MASQDHGIHSFEECVPEGSDYFQQTLEECTQEEAQLIIREEKWEQQKIKFSRFKDCSSDEEYEGLNS